MPVLRLHDAIVVIQYVHETTTKGGLRRFEIGATRTDVSDDTLAETRVSFTTLDQFKAALCQQAKEQVFPLHVKFRETIWFDAALLFVEMVKPEPVHAD